MEELGIGRPATYVNSVKTIQDRGYVKLTDIPGIKKTISTFTIRSDGGKPVMEIFEEESDIQVGQEKKKLVPTPLGITVNDYLMEHFPEMMDYKFTAKMESELDEVANGQKVWYKVVDKFYKRLKPIVDALEADKTNIKDKGRILGVDEAGHEISATRAKFGPVVVRKTDGKPTYAKIIEPLTLETITLAQALELFAYPKLLGQLNKIDVLLRKGPYGEYISYNNKSYKIPDSTKNITLELATKVIEEKSSNIIKELTVTEGGKKVQIVILKGKFGPYVTATRGQKKTNYPVPKDLDPANLTEEQIVEIISKKRTFGKSFGKKTGGTGGKSRAKKIIKKK